MPSAPLGAKLRGLAVGLCLFLTALLTCTVVFLPSLPLLLLPAAPARRVFRQICQGVQETWFSFACALLRYGLGVELFVHVPTSLGGLKGLRGKSAGHDSVLVCNHRTRVDWIFLWGLSLATGRLGSLKIVLKDALKKAPGFGWAMQCFGFIFLSRSDKESDMASLQDATAHHCREPGAGLMLLLFPEGTDLSESNVQKSHEFSKQKGLQEYNEVLHPKTAGFASVMAAAEAASRSSVDVLDATIGYVAHEPGQRPSESDLFMGRPPREVHVRLEAPALSGKGSDKKTDFAELCRKLFQAKEERLARFSKPVKAGGRPDIAALGEGCEVTALHAAPGAGARMAAATALYVLMEVLSLWTALKFKREAAAGAIGTLLVFGMATSYGGIDAWERWHAGKWPASQPCGK